MLELGNERILIIAPHSDDEILGCAGLIEKACRFGNAVKVVVVTVGDTLFWHQGKIVHAETRKQEFAAAVRYLGCTDYDVLYDDKEAQMDLVPQNELVTKFDSLLYSYKPTMVFIPYPSFHQDHQAVFNACKAGLRPRPNLDVKLIAMYEYPFISWQYPKLDEIGELYIDISETIGKKINALLKHASQLREKKHPISPESVELWAKFRGFEIGSEYAEKYYIIRSQML